MNKLLKQLVQVLDERGIQLSSLDMAESTPGYTNIEVNKEITIESRGNGVCYALYTKEGKLSPTNYTSLTEVLDVLANYLSRVKEDSILVTNSGLEVLKVIPYSSNGYYNLIDVETNTLVYSKGTSLNSIYDSFVRHGDLYVK